MGNSERKNDSDELKELSLDDLKHVAGGVALDAKVKPLTTNGGGLSESGGDDTPGPLPGN
jgi:hypothetical protein